MSRFRYGAALAARRLENDRGTLDYIRGYVRIAASAMRFPLETAVTKPCPQLMVTIR
jgi:hypothetical protein